jgi:predicted transcriptional regulator
MKKLEDFVRERRDEFDSKLPSLDLWDKIESNLEKKNTPKISFWKVSVAVAAVLVIALVSTFFIESQDTGYFKYSNISDPEIVELLETEAFYASKVSNQLKQINKCYEIYPDLKYDIESDLNELDNMYKELKNDLNDNLLNREVIEAMIQNNRIRLEMVDRVLNQINC